MQKRVKLTIDDTLSFYDDYIGDYIFNENNVRTNNYFVKVPLEWLENGQLTVYGLERFYEYLYGTTWRMGNDDGSRYLPLAAGITFLNDEQKDEWLIKQYCYSINLDGSVLKISPEEF
ncbi:MAG TPA: hypothetical protein PKY82_26070 [Pyrinomonadaceae bacterium]|nr:hypothetical protein [Pyrinomonadaceae bacterium]